MQNVDFETDNNNFNVELMELLCQETFTDDTENNTCLITNETLETNHITLTCKHKFNYDSIYNEISNQKKINYLETQKLKLWQIKCPYCRNVQEGLLPSREGFPNTRGVNWPLKSQFLPNSCVYSFLSGKRKGEWCGKKCSDKYCTSHKKIMDKRLLKEEEKLKQNSKINMKPSCSYIYKRGKQKGMKCIRCKIYKDNLCKTHYNQYCKKISKLKKSLEEENPNFKIENITIKDNKTNIKFTKKNPIISI